MSTFIHRARILLAIPTLLLALSIFTCPAIAGGGNVMPASAKPEGFSLEDVAVAMADFSSSFNQLAFYPDVPFQIIYLDGASNTFTVKTGTRLFVPLAFVDDSFPIVGDFPTTNAEAQFYYFDPSELGVEVASISVDGQVTKLTPDYVAGPVPDDQNGATHFTQIGAYLTPLTKGKHTITTHIVLDGAAIGGSVTFDDTYTVIVK